MRSCKMYNYSINMQQVAQILKTRTLFSIQDLYNLIHLYISEGKTKEEILSKLETFYWGFEIPSIDHVQLVNLILDKAKGNKVERGMFDSVILYESEIEHLKSIQNDTVRKILYTALIYSKWDNHSSGWIRYDKENFFLFWGLKLSEKEKSEIMRGCINEGLMLKVVGSKNPTVCFQINFRKFSGIHVKQIVKIDEVKFGYIELFGNEE